MSHSELNALAANVVRLSRLLTRERESLPAEYLKDKGLREAYQAYFLPSNLRKIHFPMSDLALHPGKFLEKETLRVLDLGCGPGAALLGVLDFFAELENRPRLEFLAVDQVAENLNAFEDLFMSSRSTRGLAASLRVVRSSIQSAVHLAERPCDLVILSNVLNELFAHEQNRIAKRISMMKAVLNRFLADDGSCIIIEPALRETSRALLQVRDGLVEQGFSVYAPCLCRGKCPALTNPKDWCHEDIPWDPPVLIRELDKLSGLRKDSLKFSYVVLRKEGDLVTEVFSRNSYRVVSEPLVSKGKIEFYLCGSVGRRLVVRLEKDRTARNDAFEKLRRGDVVGFERLIDDEGTRFKVGKETGVVKKSSHLWQKPA